MKIEVSNGEILDKLSILEIKLKNIKDADKLIHITNEYNFLKDISTKIPYDVKRYEKLLNINTTLWGIEDEIREKERNKEFDEKFIELARLVYITNDKRASIKLEINNNTNSNFVEVKSYKEY
tara:strand:+ start:6131 stop:6499 length:369 start_codon:yes stop_codon:yes gene_type:complete